MRKKKHSTRIGSRFGKLANLKLPYGAVSENGKRRRPCPTQNPNLVTTTPMAPRRRRPPSGPRTPHHPSTARPVPLLTPRPILALAAPRPPAVALPLHRRCAAACPSVVGYLSLLKTSSPLASVRRSQMVDHRSPIRAAARTLLR